MGPSGQDCPSDWTSGRSPDQVTTLGRGVPGEGGKPHVEHTGASWVGGEPLQADTTSKEGCSDCLLIHWQPTAIVNYAYSSAKKERYIQMHACRRHFPRAVAPMALLLLLPKQGMGRCHGRVVPPFSPSCPSGSRAYGLTNAVDGLLAPLPTKSGEPGPLQMRLWFLASAYFQTARPGIMTGCDG